MLIVRRIFVGLLSLLLLISLIGASLSESLQHNLSSPTRVENWVSHTSLYSDFINNSVSRVQNSLGSSSRSPEVTSALRQAASSALPQSDFNQDVDKAINANYAWLEGHSSSPSFSIDLTNAGKTFANNVGAYVMTQLASLSVCSPAQTAQQLTASVLSLTCRPSVLSPSQAITQVTKLIDTSSVFASNAVITANSLKLSNSNNQPYFQKLAKVPKDYQLAVKIPLLLAVLSVVLALGIFFCAPRKRRGARRIAIVLGLSGLFLVATKIASDKILTKIDHSIASHASNNLLQPSITSLANQSEAAISKINLWIGIAYIVLALLLVILLFIRKDKHKVKPAAEHAKQEVIDPSTIHLADRRPKTTPDIMRPSPEPPQPTNPQPINKPPTNPPKPPRLVQ